MSDAASFDPASGIQARLEGRPRPIGALTVRRILPQAGCRSVGPFVFLDHMGPLELAPGQVADVLPHPHIGLATVTYLFAGRLIHRDSLGTEQPIEPGAVNWMNAGRGIVHSERGDPEELALPRDLHGLQAWVGLPKAREGSAPQFVHTPANLIPAFELGGLRIRVLIGQAFGQRSPVRTAVPVLYVELRLKAGQSMPLPEDYAERGVYVVSGEVASADERTGAGSLWAFTPGARVTLRALSEAHVMLLGGAPLDGPRHLDWNFVHSDKAVIAQARADWKEGRFPTIPGDDRESVPLPE